MGESDSWGKKNCPPSPGEALGVTHPASGCRWPVSGLCLVLACSPRSRLLMNAASAEMPLDPTVDVACGVINL